ncbi:uncharacterized protein B0H18DRAFT_1125775 [Fomitopsis serialis]|uniref:uncharacterized protein n=1 Tax=Fomitopsis serialis TaxID=139415 RepID=UPI0020074F7E|nr:uncharacterized protein B0H18DRAFT_1125775 [Neoantrodia serialis]KAH9914201.1 hypothetical protein B0H18DRAFT_1125775 [Neoantrodia serialis]
MFEPKKPVDFEIINTPAPAIELEIDTPDNMRPHFVVLRHRYLPRTPCVANYANAAAQRMGQIRGSTGFQYTLLGASFKEPSNGPSGKSAVCPPVSQDGPALHEKRAMTPSGTTGNEGDAHAREGTPSPDDSLPTPALPRGSVLPPGVQYFERSMYRRTEKVCWYQSSGAKLIEAPPDKLAAQEGSIYIHDRGDKEDQQIWLWTDGNWVAASPNCAHPSLSDYRLRFTANGEPRWVTAKTITTYQGRQKKRLREQPVIDPP